MKIRSEDTRDTKNVRIEELLYPPKKEYVALTPWECAIILAICCVLSYGIGYLVRSLEILTVI